MLFFLFAFGAGAALVAYGRAGMYGPGVARDYRYMAELAPVGAIFMALLLRGVALPRHFNAIALVAAVCIGISGTVSAVRQVQQSTDPKVEAYIVQLAQTVAAYRTADHTLPFQDTAVLHEVLDSGFDPYSRVSRMVLLWDGRLRLSADPFAERSLMFDPAGHAVTAELHSQIDEQPRDCAPATFTLQATPGRPPHLRHLQLTLSSGNGGHLTLRPSSSTLDVQASGADRRWQFDLGHAELSSIEWAPAEGACLARVRLVTQRIAPAAARSGVATQPR